MAQLVVSAIRVKCSSGKTETEAAAVPSEAEVLASLERGKSIARILLEHSVSAQPPSRKDPEESRQEPESEDTTKQDKSSISKKQQKKKVRVVDRRRRRLGGRERERESSGEGSDDSDDSGSSDNGSLGGYSSDDEDLSVDNLGEDDLELLDSLSDSSSSGAEDKEDGQPKRANPQTGTTPSLQASPTVSNPAPRTSAPAKRPGRKHIVLAANFSMPPSISYQGMPQKPKASKPRSELVTDRGASGGGGGDRGHHPSSLSGPPPPSQASDGHMPGDQPAQDTPFQTAVYTTCSILAEESSLMALRVFTYWLQAYPIIIATCTQVGT